MAVEDWLMREVRKLTEMLLTLLSKATGITLDTPDEVSQVIKDRLEKELGWDLDDLLKKDDDTIITILKNNKFNAKHLELFADLLAVLYFKNEENKDLLKRAVSIYIYVQETSKIYSIALNQKIQKLINL